MISFSSIYCVLCVCVFVCLCVVCCVFGCCYFVVHIQRKLLFHSFIHLFPLFPSSHDDYFFPSTQLFMTHSISYCAKHRSVCDHVKSAISDFVAVTDEAFQTAKTDRGRRRESKIPTQRWRLTRVGGATHKNARSKQS